MQGKNKTAIITGAVLLLLVILGGVYFLTSQKTEEVVIAEEYEEEVIETLKAEEIGLELMARPDKKYVKFVINKPEGIEFVSYDILYDAVSNGNTVSQGLTGEVKKEEFKDDTIEIGYRELGTCSSGGRCRFDEGVEKVTVVLKITKTDGKSYQVEDSIDL